LSLNASGGALLVNGVTLNAPHIDLSGGSIRIDGGTVGTASTSSLGVNTAGALGLDGASGTAKLYSSGSMNISAGSLSVQAGAFPASIDPTSLDVVTPGDVVLSGGSGSNAYAELHADTVSVQAANVMISGGTGAGSYAGIVGGTGGTTVNASNAVSLLPGTGAGADAVISGQGPASVTALSCAGCSVLSIDPATTPEADGGVYGNPASVTVLSPVIPVPSSVLQAVDMAQSSAEGDTPLAQQQEEEEGEDEEGEDKDEEDKGDEAGGQAQEKKDDDKTPLPVCI
jgi:hypothetical protein